jgi:hypothetical protein
MVLPTERDQRDMSMRRHKLFFLFFFSEFFFWGFFESLFCLYPTLSNVYDYVKRMFESLVRRLSLSIYQQLCLLDFLFKILIRNSNWNRNCVSFHSIIFILFCFPETNWKTITPLFFGFCFILCLNFKIATSRISSCCAWIQIAQHFVVVGARELALGKRVGRRLVSRRSDVKRFLKKSKNKIKKSLLLLTCLLQWFCEVSLSRRCGSIWRHQLEPLPQRSSSTVFVCLFLFFSARDFVETLQCLPRRYFV